MAERNQSLNRDLQGLYEQIDRANALSEQEPVIEVEGETIHVHDGQEVCSVSIAENVWHGSCPYALANDPETRPCCHVRAVERWMYQGKIVAPGKKVLDIHEMTNRPEVIALAQYHLEIFQSAWSGGHTRITA